ncbi:MAG: endonuclease/exonuclease/phosphatase family protein, partial [Candidatus Thiodiazotropha sp.]
MHEERTVNRTRNSVKHVKYQAEYSQNKHCHDGKTHIKQLNILTLNVCGLSSKLKCPDFISFLNQYDIIGLQETKTDDTDSHIEIPGYKIFFHNRSCLSRYRSGGIALIVKECLLPYVKIDQSRKSKLILLFTVSKEIFCGDNCSSDVICGIVYIPPQGSKYAIEDPYLEIQEEIFRYCTETKNILLFGDFNSRCKNLPDHIKFDEYISDIYGMQELYDENSHILDLFERFDVPLHRKSADDSVNAYGYSLLEMCKNNDLFILNGRIGSDHVCPNLTCKNKSTVDYFISSAQMLPIIKDLQVQEFSCLLSDAHSPVSLTLNVDYKRIENNTECNTSFKKQKLWEPEKSETFVDNIDILKVSDIELRLDHLIENNRVDKDDIDDIVRDIGLLFNNCAKDTFGQTNVFSKHKQSISKPWFNHECKRARNLYHKTRQMYNKYKTTYYKNILKTVSKNYKKTLSLHYYRFNNVRINKLRAVKRSNPREYWKIINSQEKSEDIQASIHDFYHHFKNISEVNNDSNNHININEDSETNDNVENELNQAITASEILSNIKLLKNNKAAGFDSIVNEHIKATAQIMLPVYTKLFN